VKLVNLLDRERHRAVIVQPEKSQPLVGRAVIATLVNLLDSERHRVLIVQPEKSQSLVGRAIIAPLDRRLYHHSQHAATVVPTHMLLQGQGVALVAHPTLTPLPEAGISQTASATQATAARTVEPARLVFRVSTKRPPEVSFARTVHQEKSPPQQVPQQNQPAQTVVQEHILPRPLRAHHVRRTQTRLERAGPRRAVRVTLATLDRMVNPAQLVIQESTRRLPGLRRVRNVQQASIPPHQQPLLRQRVMLPVLQASILCQEQLSV
jgi:hypothetical protein